MTIKEELKNMQPVSYTSIDINQMLYHYTDINGLKGILETGQFFVSKIGFLNDYSELKYSYNLTLEVIESLINEYNDKSVNEFYNNLKDYIKNQFENEWDRNNLNHRALKYYRSREYILSFAKNDDSLTLWSEYSDFYGYNLGFKLGDLIKYLNDLSRDKISVIYSDVIYNKDEQIKSIKDEILLFVKLINKYCWNSLSYEEKKEILVSFTSRLRGYGTFFKDSKFSEENEYRFLFYSFNEETLYRTNNYCLMPYTKVPPCITKDQKLPIKSITVGTKNPLANMAIESIAYFLYDNNYVLDNIKLKLSKIALRY